MHLGAYPYCKAVKKRKERNSAPSHDPSIQGRTKRKERRESRKREERKRVKTDMRARPRSRDLELKLLSAMDTYWHRSLLRSIPYLLVLEQLCHLFHGSCGPLSPDHGASVTPAELAHGGHCFGLTPPSQKLRHTLGKKYVRSESHLLQRLGKNEGSPAAS